MRLLNRRPLFTVLVLSIVTLLLTAACAGPSGSAGSAGLPGLPGVPGGEGIQGPSGQTGPAGLPGSSGSSGATGPAGASGNTGPAGPTVPASIIVVNSDADATASQPAVIVVGEDQPKFTVYGAGFPANTLGFIVELTTADTTYIMQRISTGSDTVIRPSLTYKASFQAPKGLKGTPHIVAGLYTVTVTAGPSGVQASAPVMLVESK